MTLNKPEIDGSRSIVMAAFKSPLFNHHNAFNMFHILILSFYIKNVLGFLL